MSFSPITHLNYATPHHVSERIVGKVCNKWMTTHYENSSSHFVIPMLKSALHLAKHSGSLQKVYKIFDIGCYVLNFVISSVTVYQSLTIYIWTECTDNSACQTQVSGQVVSLHVLWKSCGNSPGFKSKIFKKC